MCNKGVNCKIRGVHYKMSCGSGGCENITYEGETSRSTGERFTEHLKVMSDSREQIRQKSVFYEHAWEVHEGAFPRSIFKS